MRGSAVLTLIIFIALATTAVFLLSGRDPAATDGDAVASTLQTADPQYDADGALKLPEDYRKWMFVGASIGLGYRERGSGDLGIFHNVYIRPESYEQFARSGEYPEKTMFVMTMYSRGEKISPAEAGYFEGDFLGLEVAVKDSERFEEGWAYFSFSGRDGPRDRARPFPKDVGCYACHKAHGAHDNTFLQFYPLLRHLKQARTSTAPSSGD